jgi:outer membrane protein OmpA-like peptidoglycan-associated protein
MNRFGNKNSDSEWLPISDLMSVLMIVFIIISVFYMLQVKEDKDRIEEIADLYDNNQKQLYQDLYDEFKNDLELWNAEIIDTTLTIRFLVPDNVQDGSPKIFFSEGSSVISVYGKDVLSDFFPRFKNIIYGKNYRDKIDEVRIEGHTSSDWYGLSQNRAYYRNMKLSQDRTRNVLEHTLESVDNLNEKKWLRSLLTSNGLSSSKLITDSLGNENYNASRRVEFRVKTKAEESIMQIVNTK